MQAVNSLREGITTGFVDVYYNSPETYRPQFLTNNKYIGKKVLGSLLKEIKECKSFWISVAFVTTDGVASIISALEEFRDQGKRGKILVSDYLAFTHPEALARLMQFGNVELRMSQNRKFHAKGYLFYRGDIYNLIIGSSNLTANALAVNTEWNLKVSAAPESLIIQNALVEFGREFDVATIVDDTFLDFYREYRKRVFVSASKPKALLDSHLDIRPNKMQVEALREIGKMREQNKRKALLISATGTGKTFLSAFDVKNFRPQRLLFVVHRRNIAEAAKRTYQAIFGNTKSMGIYSGSTLEMGSDFLFCTIQTICRQEHYSKFQPDHFDYIVVDETHRAAAQSYEVILNYFKPKFILGMTATPERTDGYDVFSLFDYNIAYEIRLQRALDEEMLVPFHYYGITEIQVDGKEITENAGFNLLVAPERVKHIAEKAKFYGTDTSEIRGLVFCSRNEESLSMAEQFRELGFRALALSGASSESDRSQAIERLESTDPGQKLDYIFTVDIFNEGIDIPTVNQVILLRPTQSAIVFVQQLGRGLRKAEGKSYLTVIDFIGNYSNNFLVPIALFGDQSYNKDVLRRLVASGSALVPGSSTIDFDKISRDRIFESITNTNLQTKKDLVNDYKLLKYRLGRRPLMMDFLNQYSRDPYQYVVYARSYYNFLVDVESGIPDFGNRVKLIFESLAKEVNNGKRVQDSVALLMMLEGLPVTIEKINDELKGRFGISIQLGDLNSIAKNINLEFATQSEGGKVLSIQEINQFQLVSLVGNELVPGKDLLDILLDPSAKELLVDNTLFSIQYFENQYVPEDYVDGFVLYRKYSRKDTLRILKWPKKIVDQNVGGSIISADKTACALFINYHKAEDISSSTKYEDGFINHEEFQWMSKSGRKITSPDIQDIKNIPSMRICLFIKKSNDEGQEHYYMGDLRPEPDSFEQASLTKDNGNPVSVVKIKFKLDRPVRDSVYEYITDVPLQEERNEETGETVRLYSLSGIVPYHHCLPYYDITVAAGDFSPEHLTESEQWIATSPDLRINNNQFVCRVTGESMNRVIPNGSLCIFEKDQGGSREGKIVLVASQSIQDSDFGAGYTVKNYHSEKRAVEGELWEHSRIVLSPKSDKSAYRPIVLEDDELQAFKVIGIFKSVL
ncbi:MAG: DUF3427 domain-containing protein [Chitinophagaceae bacterium]